MHVRYRRCGPNPVDTAGGGGVDTVEVVNARQVGQRAHDRVYTVPYRRVVHDHVV